MWGDDVTTEFVPTFLLSVLGATEGFGQERARMRIIIRSPYTYLEERLRKAFEGRDDVEIIVDRRRGQRRGSTRTVPVERRQADRRKSKDEILEIVIEGDPLTIFRTTPRR